MIDSIRSYWQFGTGYCSLEVSSTPNKETKLLAVTAKKKKGEFEDLEYETVPTFEKLAEQIALRHGFITLSTNKVLIKKVPYREPYTAVLSEAFPGLSLEEFYYEILPAGTHCFVMVCRKSYVETILKEAKKAGFSILGVHLGFSQTSALIPFLSDSGELITYQYALTYANKTITDFSLRKEGIEADSEYRIEDIQVPANYLLPLSGLFRYITPATSHSNLKSKNADLKQQFDQHVFFKKGSRLGIAILLVLLIVNFFVFNSYFQEKKQLEETLLVSKSQKEQYANRLKSIESKEKTVENILRSGTSKSTYYINRVVHAMPNTVQLTALTFQPLEKAIRPSKMITYQTHTIEVAGESNDKANFSQWIETLEQHPWVNRITVLGYGTTEQNKNSFVFSIALQDDTAN